ncbi:hypothetical protein Tco_0507505 [Tanacetum coccineum]
MFSDEMMSDVDVFRPGVLNIVAAKSYGTLVVTVQRDAIGMSMPDVTLRRVLTTAMSAVSAYSLVSAIAAVFGYQRPILMVPWRYRKTRLTASRSHYAQVRSSNEVNSFHDLSGSLVVDSVAFSARVTKSTKDPEKLAIASAQRNISAFEKISIVRAASTIVRFRLSTTPFCCGVLGTVFW